MGAIKGALGLFGGTLRDLAPIVVIVAFFQLAVLRQPVDNLGEIAIGFVFVLLGLAIFIRGLEMALFPIGEALADAFVRKGSLVWLLLFSFALGFGTTIAEPALIAVALKASEVSGGTIGTWGLRLAVALGVAVSLAVGSFRIVTGTPLYLYMVVGYVIVVVQTLYAPRMIVPLAYDSGGVTTSTVTVPLVAALGLGLASTVPGRSPLLDGFGMIALASLFPMITVMGYAQIGEWMAKRNLRANARNGAREGGINP